MSHVTGILLIVDVLLIIPYFTGILYCRWIKLENKSIMENWLYGELCICSLFYVLAIPMILAHVKFHILESVWFVLGTIISMICIIMCRREISRSIKKTLHIWYSFKKYQMIMLLAFVILIVVADVFLVPISGSQIIPTARETIKTDLMYVVNPYTKVQYSILPVKLAYAPIAMYYAAIAKISGVDVTVIIVTIMPLVLLAASGKVYCILAKELYIENRKKQCIFLGIVLAIYTILAFTEYKDWMNAFRNIWQGESILFNIVMPGMLALLIRRMRTKMKRYHEISALILILFTVSLLYYYGVFYIVFMLATVGLLALVRRIYELWMLSRIS